MVPADARRRNGVSVRPNASPVTGSIAVEREGVNFSVDLPPTVTELEVPTGVTDLGDAFKFEIIARTMTGNNTAVESCFRLPNR